MRIVYIDIDSLRADHLGCYAYPRNTSPVIDALAKEGVRFDQCYTSDAPCLPSRSAIMSGLYGIHNGIVNHGGVAADWPIQGITRGFQQELFELAWMSRLQKAGFKTATVSPFGIRHSAWNFLAGFNEIFDTGKRGQELASETTPVVLDWLGRNGSDDNWFLHLNLWDPHTPYRTPEDFGNPLEGEPYDEWLTQELLDKHRGSYAPHGPRDLNCYGDPDTEAYPRMKKELKTLDDFKCWIDGYDAGVRYSDEHVGKIVQKLKDLGVYEDTAIIISADHGENQGELGVYGDHATADLCTSRIPLIIKWPGIKPGVQENLTYNVDLPATVMDLVGGTKHERWDGRSFAENLKNGISHENHDCIVVSNCTWTCQRSVLWNNWIMIRTYYTGLKPFPAIMLFDKEKDPHMTKDLSQANEAVVNEGLAKLEKWTSDQMMTSSRDVDPMWTVIREGGPYHADDHKNFPNYLSRLRENGRDTAADIMEKYVNRPLPRSEENFFPMFS